MLLHPFALSSEVWSPISPFLEARHRVHPLSIPGHLGGDPVPEHFEYTLGAVVDVLEAKLDALGLRQVHLVGNSLGGWIAIELARRGRALSVVAISPGGGWVHGSDAHRRLRRKFQVTRALLKLGGRFAPLLASSAISRKLLLREAVARPNQLSCRQAQSMIEAAFRCDAFEQVLKVMKTQPLTEPFALPCKVRFAWGAEDRLLPMSEYSEHWRLSFPDAEWVTLAGVGHVPMFDDPAAVARCILEVTGAEGYVLQQAS